MKSERQLTILSILLQKESITVSELSKKLEVSKRTILRDIDTLAQAGIPIVSKQGLGKKCKIEEFPLWLNRIGSVLGVLGDRFNLWPGTVG